MNLTWTPTALDLPNIGAFNRNDEFHVYTWNGRTVRKMSFRYFRGHADCDLVGVFYNPKLHTIQRNVICWAYIPI